MNERQGTKALRLGGRGSASQWECESEGEGEEEGEGEGEGGWEREGEGGKDSDGEGATIPERGDQRTADRAYKAGSGCELSDAGELRRTHLRIGTGIECQSVNERLGCE